MKRTEYRGVLLILVFWIGSNNSTKIEIVDLLIIRIDELSPPLLAFLALHFVLIDRLRRVDFRELLLKMLIDIIVHLGQSELRPAHFLEDGPVRHKVFHRYEIVSTIAMASINQNGAVHGGPNQSKTFAHLSPQIVSPSDNHCQLQSAPETYKTKK